MEQLGNSLRDGTSRFRFRNGAKAFALCNPLRIRRFIAHSMATSVSNAACFLYPHPTITEPTKTHQPKFSGATFRPAPNNLLSSGHCFQPPPMATAMGENRARKPSFKWVEIGSEAQQEAIDELPLRMNNRCQALMKQIICYAPEKRSLCEVLEAWVRIMKPCRVDWLAVLKQLRIKDHPLYLQL